MAVTCAVLLQVMPLWLSNTMLLNCNVAGYLFTKSSCHSEHVSIWLRAPLMLAYQQTLDVVSMSNVSFSSLSVCLSSMALIFLMMMTTTLLSIR